MSKFTKRRGLMLLGVALSLAVAGIAFAFWTGGGSGTGSGAAANGVSGLTANQDACKGVTVNLAYTIA